MTGPHVLVLAKAPVPGLVKTRLCPPLTFRQAADLARAALQDTLDAVLACGAGRRLLALDGDAGDWLPPGFDVFAQQGRTFNERLAHAWQVAGGPGIQIGMDTPQVTADLLDGCLERLDEPGVDAVLGHATDGGWWVIGAREPHPAMFDAVPMSTADTGQAQGRCLDDLGWTYCRLPSLRDVDTAADACAVGAMAGGTRFAAVVTGLVSTGVLTCASS